MAVDVGATVDAILDPEIPHALRLQAVLIVGVSTVHARQAAFLLDDARATLKSVMLAAGGGDAKTLPDGAGGGDGAAAGGKGGKGTASAAASALGATGDLTGALLLAAGGGGLGDDLLAELEAGPLALFSRSTPATDRDPSDDLLVAGDASTLMDDPLAGFTGAADALAAVARGRRWAGAPTPRADDFVLPPGDAELAAMAAGVGDYYGGDPMIMPGEEGMVFDGGIEVAAPAAGLARRAGAARKPHPARLDRDGTTLPSATFREWMTNSAPLLVAGGRPALRGSGRGATRTARAAAAAATDDAVRARLASQPLAAGKFGDQLATLLASRTAVAGGGPAPPAKKTAPRRAQGRRGTRVPGCGPVCSRWRRWGGCARLRVWRVWV